MTDKDSGAPRVVRSAGGVVWRGVGTRREVMLVHRDRYGDWTLPKGKLDKGEAPLEAAVREVYEETGVCGVPQLRLPTVEYLTGTPGESKLVDFWSMRVVSDAGRQPDEEVTEARWVPLADAPRLMTYQHDRGVLRAFVEAPVVTAELVLVRHAHAGNKDQWAGPDSLRPLSHHGQQEVARLLPVLRLFRPERVVTASPVRCRETVAPVGLPLDVDTAWDEDAPGGTAGARAALLDLVRTGRTTVVCSQGAVIPPLLKELRPTTWPLADDFQTPKGTGWLLAFAGNPAGAAYLTGLDRLP